MMDAVNDDPEKVSPSKELSDNQNELKVDPETGVVLSPQPTDDPNDPLNWPQWAKWLILCQVALAALQTPLNSSITVATFGDLSGKWNVSVTYVSYLIAIGVVPNAVGPLFVLPFTSVFGRRPIYLIGFTIVIVTSIAGAYTTTWSQQAATRAINSFGTGTAVSIGASTITDIFFQHERGKAMGVWTLLTNTGAFWGSFIGCYVVSDGGWTWAFKAAAILNGITLLWMIFCMPETIYPRSGSQSRQQISNRFDWYDRFVRIRRRHDGQLNPLAVLRPIRMALYPSVFFPALITGISNTLIGVGISLIVPSFFGDVYGFSLKGAGNVNFALIIGAILGELFAGRWSDVMMTRLAKSHGGKRIPELRLYALWPALFLMPGGLIIFGVCLRFKTHWMGPCMGGAIAVFGYQILVTVTTTYAVDCYKPQSGYVGAWFNFVRQGLSIAIPFFDFAFAAKAGYAWEFGVYGIVIVVFAIPVMVLGLYGKRIRERLAPPGFDTDL